GIRDYHTMLRQVFPFEAYPRGWNASKNGGPPAVARTFGAALRRMNGTRQYEPPHRVFIPREVVEQYRSATSTTTGETP
ncbi:MAG: hypothetical protein AAF479_16750, partial [Pseudomonadota bacterium]